MTKGTEPAHCNAVQFNAPVATDTVATLPPVPHAYLPMGEGMITRTSCIEVLNEMDILRTRIEKLFEVNDKYIATIEDPKLLEYVSAYMVPGVASASVKRASIDLRNALSKLNSRC